VRGPAHRALLVALLLVGCGGGGLAIAPGPTKDSGAAAADGGRPDTGPGGGRPDSGADGGAGEGASLDCPDAECDGECVNLSTDARHCGGCGRTCWAGEAEAACVDGLCVLVECAPGTGDCDGDRLNGCETVVDCAEGGACATTCGSTGTQGCADVCAPTCAPPVEVCNAQDDDCDGACDEDALAGCRASLYRSSGATGHNYGRDLAEVASFGHTVESSVYFYLYVAEAPGLVPLYRCDKGGGRRFLTASSSCEIGLPVDQILGWMAPGPTCGAVPLHRLYSSAANNHFYTLSAAERDNAVAVYGYVSEGIAGYVWASP
jgi:hypothetical protein